MNHRAAIEKIVSRAVSAPSGDNSQPWEFSVSDDELFIKALPELDHPILNVEGRGTYIAIGALIENVVVASGEEGLTASVDLFPTSETAARIRFSARAAEKSPLSDAIERRHTQRGPYALSVPEDALNAIRDIKEPGVAIEIVTSREGISRIANAVSVMEEVALRTRKLHRLFFKSILWKRSDNDAGVPGLYIKTTELPPPVRAAFRVIKHWPVIRLLNKLGFARSAASANAAVYAQAGACAALLLTNTEPSDFIRAGRAMQRIWLTATASGLAAQPMAGLLYVAEYLSRSRDADFESELHLRVSDARNTIATEVRAESATIAMLLRVGVPIRPATARTARKKPVIISV
ncbi:MAG: hypothetical protein JWM46_736 [Candidatus Kaiserbacteria bacterium]|nr:hypothetical protein [Candidatus Kaiserbacteria bacterium]